MEQVLFDAEQPDNRRSRRDRTRRVTGPVARRIYRAVSRWSDVSAIVAGGGKPDDGDIAYLLRLGEPVPPDVQNYIAHQKYDPPPKEKGRPKKHPGQIRSDQWQSARRLYDAINSIRTDRRISLAQSFKEYAAIKKGPGAKSVEHEYARQRSCLRPTLNS
jgi:hypothetical protein